MRKILVLHITIILYSANAYTQVVSDSLKLGADSIQVLRSDTVDVSVDANQSSQSGSEKKPFQVKPWKEMQPLISSTAATDSLLRWQVWSGYGDFQSYRPDVISYRLGTTASPDIFHISGFLPHEQKVRMDGIRLNNPVTGRANYNFIPHRKISTVSNQYFGSYFSKIQLRDYYITQPVSYLNYDESNNNYRNLEFMFSRNLGERTNLELSYWDRRDGGFYPNNEIGGNQIVGRAYHHLNDKWLARAFFLRNKVDRDEPFGYEVNDPLSFQFDEFTSTSIESNARSDHSRWDLVTGLYHRKNNLSTENAGLEMSISRNDKKITASDDTTGWNIRSYAARVFRNLQFGRLKIDSELELIHNETAGMNSLNIDDWTVVSSGLEAAFKAGSFLIYGTGSYSIRSTDDSEYEAGFGLSQNFADKLYLNANAYIFSLMPTIQAKYWSSEQYYNNPFLRNELGYAYFAQAEFRLNQSLNLGAKWRYKNAKRETFLHADSTFYNSNAFQQYAATVYGRYDGRLLEIESSATAHLTEYCCSDESSFLNELDPVIWIRNSAFVKGYVFDRAAYLKIGIKTLFSPLYYSSRTFNTELQYWQGGSNYTNLPPFFRLDAELSAKIRAIMVVLRWENALDGMGQAGYFETAGYPMPPRRLIVGIRAQFRN